MLSFLTRLDDELGEGPRNWSWRIWLPLSIGSLVLLGAAVYIATISLLAGLLFLMPFVAPIGMILLGRMWASIVGSMRGQEHGPVPREDLVPAWVRWVASHAYLTTTVTATVVGLAVSAVWTATDYQFQWNNYLLRALVIGGASFGVVAWTVLSVCREVDRFDRRHQGKGRL